MTKLSFDVFDTALGWVAVVASLKGVRRMTLPEPSYETAFEHAQPDILEASYDPDAVSSARSAVVRYCAGEPEDLTTVALDIGIRAPFFHKAWDACRSIPRGEVRSYQWLAGKAGNPMAARAAGQAMARNRAALLIPCHRVVGATGSLQGFGGSLGIGMKERLLKMEDNQSSCTTPRQDGELAKRQSTLLHARGDHKEGYAHATPMGAFMPQ